jgi:beta-glucosidase
MAGVATVQAVLAIQSTRASACVKHYIANEQEHFRGGSGAKAATSNIDDRTLRALKLSDSWGHLVYTDVSYNHR